MCHMHISGLLAELLFRKKLYPHGCNQFQKISLNIAVDEAKLKDDEELMYTPEDLAFHLKESARLCLDADNPELVPQILSKAVHIYESSKSFVELRDLYARMTDAMDRVIDFQSKKRYFGKFYRVAFYGKDWEDYDQRIFIYKGMLSRSQMLILDRIHNPIDHKRSLIGLRMIIFKEPKLTQLNEVRARLEEMYSKRFGAEKFEIITDSKPIQELKLDPNRVYLQLTSVEPYFEGPGEPPSGDFEESHGLTKFVYETPFTKDGKARTDDVTKQWMTKNISITGTIFHCELTFF